MSHILFRIVERNPIFPVGFLSSLSFIIKDSGYAEKIKRKCPYGPRPGTKRILLGCMMADLLHRYGYWKHQTAWVNYLCQTDREFHHTIKRGIIIFKNVIWDDL